MSIISDKGDQSLYLWSVSVTVIEIEFGEVTTITETSPMTHFQVVATDFSFANIFRTR